MDPIVVDKIQNIGIYKQSLDLKTQLEVLGQSLNKLQAANVTLAIAFDVCNDLLANPNLQQYYKKIKENSEKAIKPFHALCFITDFISFQSKCEEFRPFNILPAYENILDTALINQLAENNIPIDE
jgi:hypothetical protein